MTANSNRVALVGMEKSESGSRTLRKWNFPELIGDLCGWQERENVPSRVGSLEFRSSAAVMSCACLSPLRKFSEGKVDSLTNQTAPSNWQIARDSVLVSLFREKWAGRAKKE